MRTLEQSGWSFPADYNPYNEKRTIAFLDIETLSLSQNAAIIEIGIVTSVMNGFYERLDAAPVECLLPLNVVDQVVLGREVSPGTVLWLKRLWGEKDLLACFREDRATFKDSVGLLRDILDPCAEIWVNHPSFDIARMDSLNETVFGQAAKPLYEFRKVHDLYSFRNTLALVKVTASKAVHRGVEDAKWNMEVVQKIGQVKKFLYETQLHGVTNESS